MDDELLEIIVLTRKDSAGLPIPELIFINDGIEGPSQYQVERIIRRDNEIIEGEKTTMFTCLVKIDNKKYTWDVRYYHDDNRWVLYRS